MFDKNYRLTNIILLICGGLSFLLGVLGVIVPLLPTTPLILLAAFCFSKGSSRAYRWLMENDWSREIVERWKKGKGIPTSTKIKTLLFTILSFSYSIYAVGFWYVRAFLIVIFVIVSTFIIRMPTSSN